jgi:hypothetical protein
MLWLRFEDAVKDWPSALKATLEFYGVRKSDAEIREALERTYQLDSKVNRVNVAKTKGSKVVLSERQKRNISRLASFYPWVDFSPIGLQVDQAAFEA